MLLSDSLSGEGLASWFIEVVAVSSHDRGSKRTLWGIFYKVLIPFRGIPLSWPDHFPKALPANTVSLGASVQHKNLGAEDTSIQSPAQGRRNPVWGWCHRQTWDVSVKMGLAALGGSGPCRHAPWFLVVEQEFCVLWGSQGKIKTIAQQKHAWLYSGEWTAFSLGFSLPN